MKSEKATCCWGVNATFRAALIVMHIHGRGVASCELLTTSETASRHASVNNAFFSGCALEGSWVMTTWLRVSLSSVLQISSILVVQLQPDANMHGVDHNGACSLWRCMFLIHTK